MLNTPNFKERKIMQKKALVINKKEFIAALGEMKIRTPEILVDTSPVQTVCLDGSKVLDFKPKLIDRSEAETNEAYLQIIPYITLVHLEDNGSNEPDPKDEKTKFFVYTRGPIGNEGRLHGKCSLGLGGHIEEEPTQEKTFDQVISSGAFKELREEVGLDVKDFDPEITFSEYGNLFLDDSDPVGRVHLGLSVTLFVNPKELKETEKDIITKGRWLNSREIIELTQSGEDPIVLENWSKMYLNNNLGIKL